ncbi:hypothetical protein KI387_037257, partial [Taxus chinensis]
PSNLLLEEDDDRNEDEEETEHEQDDANECKDPCFYACLEIVVLLKCYNNPSMTSSLIATLQEGKADFQKDEFEILSYLEDRNGENIVDIIVEAIFIEK